MAFNIRKILGWSLLLLLAFPAIYFSIWTFGLTKGAFSTEVLVNFPQKLISNAPQLVDEVFTQVQNPDSIKDENTRKWISAAANLKTTPSALLAQLGIFSWLESDVQPAFADMSRMLKGEIPFRNLAISTTPLDNARRSPELAAYFRQLTSSLSACSPTENRVWQEALNTKDADKFDNLPACNPGQSTVTQTITWFQSDELKPPPAFPLSDNESYNGKQVDVVGTASNTMAGILILVCGLPLILGALLATRHNPTRMRIAGIVVGISALCVLVTSFIFGNTIKALLFSRPAWWEYSSEMPWSQQLNDYLSGKLNELVTPTASQLIQPVTNTAQIVLIAGLIITAFSFFISRSENVSAPSVPPPPPVAPLPEPEITPASSKTRKRKSRRS